MDIFQLIEVLKALPADVVVPGLAVFALLQVLKTTGVVGEDNFARVTALAMSFLAGGGLTINSLDGSLEAGGVAVVATLAYKGWAYLRDRFLNKTK